MTSICCALIANAPHEDVRDSARLAQAASQRFETTPSPTSGLDNVKAAGIHRTADRLGILVQLDSCMTAADRSPQAVPTGPVDAGHGPIELRCECSLVRQPGRGRDQRRAAR